LEKNNIFSSVLEEGQRIPFFSSYYSFPKTFFFNESFKIEEGIQISLYCSFTILDPELFYKNLEISIFCFLNKQQK
jgi:hypothetical protein